MEMIFKALADKNRRMIITLLKDKELNVGDIQKYFKIGQATISSHLAVLRKAEILNIRVSGRERYYSLNKEAFGKFVEKINNFVDMDRMKIIKKDIVVR